MHQNLALVEDLTVWQNLFLNREIVRGFGPFAMLNRRAMREKAKEMVSGLAVNVPAVGSGCAACRVASVKPYRSAVQPVHVQVIIMDEPTAALGVQETAASRS